MFDKTSRRLRQLRERLLARPVPLYRDFGFARGWPIDRHYIEGFLATHAADIAGEVLEAGSDPDYATRFGGSRIATKHVLYPVPGLAGGTLVANLETGEGLSADAYDCMILTQVLQFIYDMPAAVRHIHRALREGGVVLATFAGISQISPDDMKSWGEFWRPTDAAARRLFEDVFGAGNVEVEVFGNVLSACAFLNGLVISDLEASDLDYRDPEYQVIVAVRARKP